jgi:multidrug resistance efflux pump
MISLIITNHKNQSNQCTISSVISVPSIMEELNKIEIRSEEVQEILGYVPRWIVKSGIGVIFAIIILLFIGSWYFKYPDIISSPITVTTENPPAPLIARTSGKISMLLVADKQVVHKGEILSIVENTANYSHVLELRLKLDALQNFFLQYDTSLLQNFNPAYQLGTIQTSYSSFLKLYYEYLNFIKLDYHRLKIEAINRQLQQTQFQASGTRKQSILLKQDLDLASLQFSRDSGLYSKSVIPASEFEKAQRDYIQKKYAWESSRTSVVNSEIQLSQLEQSVLDLKLQKQEQKSQLQLQLKSAYDILKSDLDSWALTYLFQSPIDGTASFSKIWSQNQNISIGETAFTVVPNTQGQIIGKLQLPIAGSGKVKTGQLVNIKFNSFPYMEYGTIQGTIKSIAMVPEQEFYLVTVELQQELKTNYGKILPFSQQMNGTAEIITENISVLGRLFNPLRAVFKKYQ